MSYSYVYLARVGAKAGLWTLDWTHGLDYGLKFGLGFGLKRGAGPNDDLFQLD